MASGGRYVQAEAAEEPASGRFQGVVARFTEGKCRGHIALKRRMENAKVCAKSFFRFSSTFNAEFKFVVHFSDCSSVLLGRYGFINVAGTGASVFMHHTAVAENEVLQAGDGVSFELAERDGEPLAVKSVAGRLAICRSPC